MKKREIKFRGKSIVTGEWLYGFLINDEQGNPMIATKAEWIDGREYYMDAEYVQEETIGQNTGLKDANGKEIYEGDIVSDGEYSHVVSYSLGDACFVVICVEYFSDEKDRTIKMSRVYQNWLTEYEKEVIGNIYDNQELIK